MGTGVESITQKERVSDIKCNKIRTGDRKISLEIEANTAWTEIGEDCKEPSGCKES